MTIRFLNRTSQAATYKTGSPNYIDCSAGAAASMMVTFPVQEAAGAIADGDEVSVLVFKDASNFALAVASWVAATDRLNVVRVETSVGSLANNDAVVVTATPTQDSFSQCPVVTETGTSRTLSMADKGCVIACTSSSAVTITLDSTLPIGFHAILVQEGTGAVSIARANTDTLNGGTENISLAGRWKSSYVYQRTEGAWTVIA